jgi:hypothetical protein
LGDEKRKIFTGPNPLHNRWISRESLFYLRICTIYEAMSFSIF